MKNLSYTLTSLSLVLSLAGFTQGQAAVTTDTAEASAAPAGGAPVQSLEDSQRVRASLKELEEAQKAIGDVNVAIRVGRGELSGDGIFNERGDNKNPVISSVYGARRRLDALLVSLGYFEAAGFPNVPKALIEAVLQAAITSNQRSQQVVAAVAAQEASDDAGARAAEARLSVTDQEREFLNTLSFKLVTMKSDLSRAERVLGELNGRLSAQITEIAHNIQLVLAFYSSPSVPKDSLSQILESAEMNLKKEKLLFTAEEQRAFLTEISKK